MRNVVLFSAVLSALSLSIPAMADVVTTSPSGATVVQIPNNQQFGQGPFTVAPGITWSTTDDGAVFGWTNGWGMGDNHNWGSNDPMVGNNGYDDVMTFSFETPVSAVGALFDYYPVDGKEVTISAYDSSHNLLETYSTTFSVAGDNEGQFLGFQESSADISYFSAGGPVLAARDLTIINGSSVAATPEPSSFALLGTGLVGIAGSLRRKFRKA